MIHGRRVLDAHQHFWQLGPGAYRWLTPEAGDLHADFGVADVEPHAAAAGVDDVVLVQADPTRADTDAMLAVADAWSRVVGVVGWAPLDDPGGLAAALEAYAADPRVVGLRHQIHDEPDPDWVVRPEVLAGLAEVAAAGLTYDVVAVLPRHLEHVPTLAARHPGLRIVVDHLAKPPVADKGWDPWAELLRQAAAHPNVTAKLSGLDTAAAPGYGVGDLAPYVEHALEVFGPERLMFGSDWPVSVLAGGYARWWEVVGELVAPLTEDEQVAVLGGSARGFYGIEEKA
ncbi:amidohydrolase family protein [Nocardioides zeae]|uniref:Amidohydrolase family protein n=1 Tax=Nocardioides imazamoxiresistens TaxID=3231893 RepID=A0ABU3PSR8_9ACTN|nr:amidohydrolase family protein [Nocardioides zeae]MDT9592276.1 amidohydrolase family protein [Nocardioides zeae]